MPGLEAQRLSSFHLRYATNVWNQQVIDFIELNLFRSYSTRAAL